MTQAEFQTTVLERFDAIDGRLDRLTTELRRVDEKVHIIARNTSMRGEDHARVVELGVIHAIPPFLGAGV